VYAIIETGAKQYRVSKGDVFEAELLDLKGKKEVKLDKVLFISDKKEVSIGNPYIKGASVACEVCGEKKDKKVVSLKYRRRHASSKRMVGHRQKYAVLKVKEIVT
jgi:large subunit ribosomal protein L21